MRVLIIGPVNTQKYFGGVAIFTESLADGFAKREHDVRILTDYSQKESTILGTEIISVSNKLLRKNVILPMKMEKVILNLNPDLVITSLEYGLVNIIVKNKLPKTKFIHFLHAFPSKKRKAKDNFFINNITKLIVSNSDYSLSNSGLTHVINSEILGIRSDGIINIGIGYEFLDFLGKKEEVVKKKKGKILYVGRLVSEKNVDSIICAYGKIKKDIKYATLTIVGDGPERERLETLNNNYNLDIEFTGRLFTEDIINEYLESEVFVSLNPHEPFGIVFLEALATNCKIVCPKSGGQIEVLANCDKRVFYAYPYDTDNVANQIIMALNQTIKKIDFDLIIREYSYQKVAAKIENFIKGVTDEAVSIHSNTSV